MCSNRLVATPCQSSLPVWYRFLLRDFAIERYLSGNSSNHWRKSGNGRYHVRALGEKASEHCAATANKVRMCHFFSTASTHRNVKSTASAKTLRHHMQWLLSRVLCHFLTDTCHTTSAPPYQEQPHTATVTSLAITSFCFPREISRLLFVLSLSTHTNSTTFCEHIHHALWPSAASLQVLT